MDTTQVDPDQIQSVCLALGPYRNLTTLTAGLLALHPACQVLNHAGVQLLPDPERNFLADYSPGRMRAFLRSALDLSAGGERGQQGGAITKSHAFDPQHPLGRLYQARYGEATLKDSPTVPVLEGVPAHVELPAPQRGRCGGPARGRAAAALSDARAPSPRLRAVQPQHRSHALLR
ncbi:MAG: hypothetical protein O2816_19990 [Planctomycetota bacterium]|nr:hypothetical protein [Planctomycetota bacterium]